MTVELRLACIADAPVCAKIVSDWIDETDWLPRMHSRMSIEEMIAAAIPMREFWVAGNPILGYLSFNSDASQIMGLYTAVRGGGVGKALMDRVKEGRKWIHLWSHAVNFRAHKFYRREGFVEIESKSEGADGIPEIHMEWTKNIHRLAP